MHVHIDQVMIRDDSGLGAPLLRIISDRTPDEFGPGAVEEHIVPLVPAIVSESSAATRTLYITPPHGLLQLGRRRMVLNYLRHALLVRVAKWRDPGADCNAEKEDVVGSTGMGAAYSSCSWHKPLVCDDLRGEGMCQYAFHLSFRTQEARKLCPPSV